MSRAVGNLRATRGDGVDGGGVDGRGGQGDVVGGHGGSLLASRAVGDGLRAGSDGDQLGGVVGGDGLLGEDRGGQDSSGDGETHLECLVFLVVLEERRSFVG